MVDKDFLSVLQSVSVTPISTQLLSNISEGEELQSGDTLVHECSTWLESFEPVCKIVDSVSSSVCCSTPEQNSSNVFLLLRYLQWL